MRFFIVLFAIVLSFGIELPEKFSADFNQTIVSDRKTLHYSGKVYYKNNEIVWEYTKPYKKTIWVKDKIYVYEPDLMQVTVIEKKEANLITLIKHAKKTAKNQYIAKYNGIEYHFKLSGKYPKIIYYTDKMGNIVKVVFFNIKKEVNKNIFTPNFPDDVDVIYQK